MCNVFFVVVIWRLLLLSLYSMYILNRNLSILLYCINNLNNKNKDNNEIGFYRISIIYYSQNKNQ